MANGDNQVDDEIDFQPISAQRTPAPRPAPAPTTAQPRVDDGIDFQPHGAAAAPAGLAGQRPPSPRNGGQRSSGDGIDFQPHAQTPAPAAQPRETISAYTPTLGTRLKNIFTEGVPRYSSRTVNNPKYGQMQLASPEEAMTPGEQQRHPVATGISEVAGGLTTPQNVAILAGTGGLGSLPGAAGRILPRVVSGAFTAMMAWDAYKRVPEFKAAIDRGDTSEALRIGTHIAATGVMGYLAGRHALSGRPALQPAEAAEETRATPAQAPASVLRPIAALPPAETIAGEPIQTRIGPSAQPLITPEGARTPEGAIRAPASPLSSLKALPAARGPEPDEAADFLAGKPVGMPPMRVQPIGVVEDYARGYKPSFTSEPVRAPAAGQAEIDFRPLGEERSAAAATPPAARAPQTAAESPASTQALPATQPTAAPETAAAPQAAADKSAEMQRAANLAFGQLRRNPIEQQYARDVWTARMAGERSPQPPEGMALARARTIQNKMAGIASGENLPSVLSPDPRTSGQFAPDELEAAHQRMAEASSMLAQQTPPGRYRAESEDLGAHKTDPWYGVTSLRTMFPWFADMKESPAELARAIERRQGPAYHRLLQSAAEYEVSSRQATQNIMRDVAPDLDQLVEQVRGMDPQLAQTLADAAAGKLGSGPV